MREVPDDMQVLTLVEGAPFGFPKKAFTGDKHTAGDGSVWRFGNQLWHRQSPEYLAWAATLPAQPPAPVQPYFAWEQGYAAALSDIKREADGTPGHEYTSNPYSLGEEAPADELSGKAAS